MKTILVTGGAGFIGSHLIKRLLCNNKVIVIDNFNDYYDITIKEENIQQFLDNSNFTLYRTDIRNETDIHNIFEKEHIEMIIHLAAMAGVRPSIENPILYQDVNGRGTQIILEEASKHNVQKIVMASSSSVYGNSHDIPFSESMNTDYAVSPYAATKKANEIMAYVYHNIYNMDIMMLRFFTVYGPNQRPDLAISKFTRLILDGQKIPVFGDGTTKRDYTYVDDIVDGILKASNYILKNQNVYEIVNIGSSNPISLKTMIEVISKELKIKPKIQKLPKQLGDVDCTYADITKAKKLIGYTPKVSFEEGIKKYVNWYLQTRKDDKK